MNSVRSGSGTAFAKGESVYLAEGTYQGTRGTFLKLRPDINWAEIQEQGGLVRCHPVIWLKRSELTREGK